LHFHAGGNKNYQKSNTLKLRVKFSEGVREPVPTIRHRLCGLIPGTPVPSSRDPIRSIEHPCVVESPKKNQQYAIHTRYVKGRRRERKEKKVEGKEKREKGTGGKRPPWGGGKTSTMS